MFGVLPAIAPTHAEPIVPVSAHPLGHGGGVQSLSVSYLHFNDMHWAYLLFSHIAATYPSLADMPSYTPNHALSLAICVQPLGQDGLHALYVVREPALLTVSRYAHFTDITPTPLVPPV